MSVAKGDGEGPLMAANVSLSGYTRLWWESSGGLSHAHLTVIFLQSRLPNWETGCGKKGRLAFPASLGPSRAT